MVQYAARRGASIAMPRAACCPCAVPISRRLADPRLSVLSGQYARTRKITFPVRTNGTNIAADGVTEGAMPRPVELVVDRHRAS